jgi:hypothetical protein
MKAAAMAILLAHGFTIQPMVGITFSLQGRAAASAPAGSAVASRVRGSGSGAIPRPREAFRISGRKKRDHDFDAAGALFELNGARVTPHIATFGGTSYQIANIASVHVARRKKYNPLAVIIFVLGLGILAAAIVKSRMTGLAEEYSSMAATGVAVMVASVLLQLIWPRRVYVLVLRTSSGEVDAVMSRNKEFAFNVQKAC